MKTFALTIAAIAVLPSVAAAQGPDGKAIYAKSCKECHGAIGKPPKASLRKYDSIPDLTSADFAAKVDEKELLKAIREGKGRDMKGFKDKLSPEEIEAVTQYIRTLVKEKQK